MIKIVISLIIIVFAVAALMKAAGKKTPKEDEKRICFYNDQIKCYEVPCKYCTNKKECQLVCSGDCDKCEGLRLIKNNK
jgi:hypothetical protein